MVNISTIEFEKVLETIIDELPCKISSYIKNVVIVVEDEAAPEIIEKFNLSSPLQMFGLYQGVPQTQRGIHYGNVLPDKISIFKRSICLISRNRKELFFNIRKTLIHEIAHHFGLDEKSIAEEGYG